MAQQVKNLCLVFGNRLNNVSRRSGGSLEDQMFPFNKNGQPCSPGSFEDQNRAHNRLLKGFASRPPEDCTIAALAALAALFRPVASDALAGLAALAASVPALISKSSSECAKASV